MPALVSALNRVDLPTLGRPTMPHLRLMGNLSQSMGGRGRMTGSADGGGPRRQAAAWIRTRGGRCAAGIGPGPARVLHSKTAIVTRSGARIGGGASGRRGWRGRLGARRGVCGECGARAPGGGLAVGRTAPARSACAANPISVDRGRRVPPQSAPRRSASAAWQSSSTSATSRASRFRSSVSMISSTASRAHAASTNSACL